MSIKSAIKFMTIVSMSALSLAACGSSNSKGTATDSNSTSSSSGATSGNANSTSGSTTGTIGTNPADPNGASVLSTNSPVVAATTNGNINLPYVIFAQNSNATDSNKVYGIQFSDYDPCTQGSEYGWNTFPGTQSYSVLGFYFPSAPSAQSYTIGSAAGDILTADGALGEKFTAATSAGVTTCTATTWAELASGTVNVTAADATSVTGTLTITLGDGSTVSGNFQSGSCSATATGTVLNPNAAGQCTVEK